ncbi:hypothetical protein CCR92_00745 [Rhodospirillum rubrum]|nr:hypothetical protein [Rhodospirillum rubrum]
MDHGAVVRCASQPHAGCCSGATQPSVARHADGGASARSFRLPTAFRRPVRRSLPYCAAR